jgi:predicted DNA binding protein
MKKTNNLIDKFLEELRKVPIVQVACEKTGISRNSIYRWKRKDEKFSQKMEQALIDGEAFVNDMSESQLLSMIKEGEWPAISFWLRHRNPKFKDKMEITAKIVDEKLTPEQEEVVRKALELGSIIKIDNQEKNNDIQQQ